jgi:large conductance mechanosensitive channel
MAGFRKFLMQGELIVIAVGLVVALAFEDLIKSFTTNIITPIIDSVQGNSGTDGLHFTINGQPVLVGSFISGIIEFVIFMAVIYFVLVVPYRRYMAARGTTVFGDAAPTKTCIACLSADLPVAATKCLHCGTDQAVAAPAPS